MNLKDKILEQQDILENYKYFLDKLELKDNDKTFELYLKELMIIYVEGACFSKVVKFNFCFISETFFEGKPTLRFESNLIRVRDSEEYTDHFDYMILNMGGKPASGYKTLSSLLKKKLK